MPLDVFQSIIFRVKTLNPSLINECTSPSLWYSYFPSIVLFITPAWSGTLTCKIRQMISQLYFSSFKQHITWHKSLFLSLHAEFGWFIYFFSKVCRDKWVQPERWIKLWLFFTFSYTCSPACHILHVKGYELKTTL